MRIRSVGHACVEIEAAGQRIVTDPWWVGPAYSDQWHPFPAPRPEGLSERLIDYLWLSSARPDHLHPRTLRTLRSGAVALIPELVARGTAEGVREGFGFSKIVEMPHGRRLRLRGGLWATSYVNLASALLVLEGDLVVLQLNDALCGAAPAVLDHFCQLLRRKHPRIDVLLAHPGPPAWTSACVQLPGHDSLLEVQQALRDDLEGLFAAVACLQPKVACLGPPAYVLLEPHHRWINRARLEGFSPAQQWEQAPRRGATRVQPMLPGDMLEGIQHRSGPGPLPSPADLERAYATTLKDACTQAQTFPALSRAELEQLAARVELRARENRPRLGRIPPFIAELRLRDRPGTSIVLEVGRAEPRVYLGHDLPGAVNLELRAELLRRALEEEDGLEALVAGFGVVVTLREPAQLAHAESVLKLLSPRGGGFWLVARLFQQAGPPAAGALWRQRWPLTLHLGSRLGVFPRRPENRLVTDPVPPPPRDESARQPGNEAMGDSPDPF